VCIYTKTFQTSHVNLWLQNIVCRGGNFKRYRVGDSSWGIRGDLCYNVNITFCCVFKTWTMKEVDPNSVNCFGPCNTVLLCGFVSAGKIAFPSIRIFRILLLLLVVVVVVLELLWRSWSSDSLRAEWFRVSTPVGRNFPRPFTLVPSSTQPLVKWVLGLFPGGKATGTWRWPPVPF
jgi:hypothetical protein